MNMRPVPGWNANVKGLRSPSAQIARLSPVAVLKNGLSVGIVPSVLMRSILPSRLLDALRVGAVRVLADGDVELAVGAEVDRAAVVVGRAAEVVELEQFRLAAGHRHVAVGGEAADAVVDRAVVAVV